MKTFGKRNFLFIAISLVLIIGGFILMAGGAPKDGIEFNPEIFSSQRIIIAPIITLLGFLLMIYAIMLNPNKKNS